MKDTVSMRVTKRTSINLNIMQRLLVLSKGRGVIYFEEDHHLARQEQLLFAKRIIEDLRNRPFRTILKVNSTNAKLHSPKYIVNSQSSITLSTIVDTKVTCQQSLVDN